MDCVFTWAYNSLMNELTQGMEHTKQLRTYLSSVASTSEATPNLLLQKILSSYEQSLLILKWTGSPVQSPPPAGAIESMVPGDGSPRNDDKKRSFKDHQEPIDISKKRKSQPTWTTEQVKASARSESEGPNTLLLLSSAGAIESIASGDGSDDKKRSFKDHQRLLHISKRRKPQFTEQVRVSIESGIEGPLDDGYSWRKYGQKNTLGAKYPRSFYRCTYRHMQNCWATKQVQRSDDDPTAFEIIYRGSHTCHLATNSALHETSPEREASQQSLIVGIHSPSFVCPTTPHESKCLSVSSCNMNDFGIVHNLDHSESYLSDVGIFLDLHHSDSDRTDTFSDNTSTTSSSIGGEFTRLDFSIWSKRHPQTEDNTPQKDD